MLISTTGYAAVFSIRNCAGMRRVCGIWTVCGVEWVWFFLFWFPSILDFFYLKIKFSILEFFFFCNFNTTKKRILCLLPGCVDLAITAYKSNPVLLRNTIITMAVTTESSCLQHHLNATITEHIQQSVAKCKILFAKRDELVYLIEKNAELGKELLAARNTYEHIAQSLSNIAFSKSLREMSQYLSLNEFDETAKQFRDVLLLAAPAVNTELSQAYNDTASGVSSPSSFLCQKLLEFDNLCCEHMAQIEKHMSTAEHSIVLFENELGYYEEMGKAIRRTKIPG